MIILALNLSVVITGITVVADGGRSGVIFFFDGGKSGGPRVTAGEPGGVRQVRDPHPMTISIIINIIIMVLESNGHRMGVLSVKNG